jgi:aminoglycoside phosphotransferase family enzyme
VESRAHSLTSTSLAEKVAFLGRADIYGATGPVICRETHMSWVFLAGSEAYKLKKPLRLPYLDFSTLERRRAACEAELALNRRLAPDVYKHLTPLTRSGGRYELGGAGEVVDWLVVMRRLDESASLERLLLAGTLTVRQLDTVIATLAGFYRRTRRVGITPDALMVRWQANLTDNRRILLNPRLGLPAGLVLRLDGLERVLLWEHQNAIRSRARFTVDGHGDLRPEHIWPGPPVHIIDCLEFNARLRAVDPLDEMAFLALECERLGGKTLADHVKRRAAAEMPGGYCEAAFGFYRRYRAMLRARLAIAHLLDPHPRTPEKWPRLALCYLKLASDQ